MHVPMGRLSENTCFAMWVWHYPMTHWHMPKPVNTLEKLNFASDWLELDVLMRTTHIHCLFFLSSISHKDLQMVYETLRSVLSQLQDVQVVYRGYKRTNSALSPSPPTWEAICGTKCLMFALNLASTCRAEDTRKQEQKTAGPECNRRRSLEASFNTPLCSTGLIFALLFWLKLLSHMILLGRKGASWGDLQLCIQNRHTKVSVTSTWQEKTLLCQHHPFSSLSSLGNFWCSVTLLTEIVWLA